LTRIATEHAIALLPRSAELRTYSHMIVTDFLVGEKSHIDKFV